MEPKGRTVKVPYTDFSAQNAGIRLRMTEAFEDVIDSGAFVLGPRLSQFEDRFSQEVGSTTAVGVSNGTCSLRLIVEAMQLEPEAEIITAPNSFFASVASIVKAGAQVRFADVLPDGNLSADSADEVISANTAAVMPVHLAGRPVNMHEFDLILAGSRVEVIEDAAQAVGSSFNDIPVGSWGIAASFSFHPLKTLFCFGDGGIITTRSEALAERLKLLRNHGLSSRDTCEFWSSNCRLDELQAALLLVNLETLQVKIAERRRIASWYNEALSGIVTVPREQQGEFHTYQSYVIQSPERNELLRHLREEGIEALVHYPKPLHLQPAARSWGYARGDFPEAERYCNEALSLPIYPGMPDWHIETVIRSILNFGLNGA